MGAVSPQTHSVVISRVPECVIEIDLLSIWQIPHIGSLTYGFRTIMLGKDKWKPLELPPSRKLVNQYCIPRTIACIRTIIKDLKDAGVLISTAYPFDLPFSACAKDRWRMTVADSRFNQVLTPIAGTIPHVVSLLE